MNDGASQPAPNGKSPTVKLSTEIGTEMQMEIGCLSSRIKLTMIGLLDGKYLIFHLPPKIYAAIGNNLLKPNISINIRGISKGEAYGFTTSIIMVNQTPDTLMFVKYPHKIQQHTIRQGQRIKCLLPTRLFQDTVSIVGVVADISRNGCQFQARMIKLKEEQSKMIESGEIVTLAITLPGVSEEKNLPVIIRNTTLTNEKIEFGIQFKDVDKATLDIVDKFIAMSID